MLYFQSDFVGKKIRAKLDGADCGRVESIVIDFETGKILGIFTESHVISIQDILKWVPEIEIRDRSLLLLPSDIVRIKMVFDSGITILGNTVKTEKNQIIGKVIDFILDLSKESLSSLYVSKKFFGFPLDKRIIPASQIVEIRKDAIIVTEQILRKKIILKDLVTNRGTLRPADAYFFGTLVSKAPSGHKQT